LSETVSGFAGKESWPDTWNRIQVVKNKNKEKEFWFHIQFFISIPALPSAFLFSLY
jgi:hypothetical protein